jgi:hypothetical protein
MLFLLTAFRILASRRLTDCDEYELGSSARGTFIKEGALGGER